MKHHVQYIGEPARCNEAVVWDDRVTAVGNFREADGAVWVFADPSSEGLIDLLRDAWLQAKGVPVPAIVVVDIDGSPRTAEAVIELALVAQTYPFEAWNMDMLRGPNAIVLIRREDLPVTQCDLERLAKYVHGRPHVDYLQHHQMSPLWIASTPDAEWRGWFGESGMSERRWWSADGSPVHEYFRGGADEAPPFWFPSVRLFGREFDGSGSAEAFARLVPLSWVARWMAGDAPTLMNGLPPVPPVSTPALATAYLGWLVARLAPNEEPLTSVSVEILSTYRQTAPTSLHDLYSVVCRAAWDDMCDGSSSRTIAHRLFESGCAAKEHLRRITPMVDARERMWEIKNWLAHLDSGYVRDDLSALPRHREAIRCALEVCHELLMRESDRSNDQLPL